MGNTVDNKKINKLGIVATFLLILSFFLPYLSVKGISFIKSVAGGMNIYSLITYSWIGVPVALFVFAGFIFSNRNNAVALFILSGILMIANGVLNYYSTRDVIVGSLQKFGINAGIGCIAVYLIAILYLIAGVISLNDRSDTSEMHEETKQYTIQPIPVNSKNCIYCGYSNRDNNRFCNKCGCPLK